MKPPTAQMLLAETAASETRSSPFSFGPCTGDHFLPFQCRNCPVVPATTAHASVCEMTITPPLCPTAAAAVPALDAPASAPTARVMAATVTASLPRHEIRPTTPIISSGALDRSYVALWAVV